MKWITRERVKVDRVACPWLIKKFVDKDAEFIFVPADKVTSAMETLEQVQGHEDGMRYYQLDNGQRMVDVVTGPPPKGTLRMPPARLGSRPMWSSVHSAAANGVAMS